MSEAVCSDREFERHVWQVVWRCKVVEELNLILVVAAVCLERIENIGIDNSTQKVVDNDILIAVTDSALERVSRHTELSRSGDGLTKGSET